VRLATNSEVLLRRKQQVVQDAIWNAAIDLFGKKGFDETTVDDIAAAAGVSQRTFFRYFASKSDLMGQGMLTYGEALRAAIKASPKSANAFDVLRGAVLDVATTVASFPRTRDVIAISIKCPAAREAQLSRMGQVEQIVAQAFAARMKKGRENEMSSRLLGGLTLTILDETMRLWFNGGTQDIAVVAEQVMKGLCSLVAGADG
jgi:AcrR family transcriptional regulator